MALELHAGSFLGKSRVLRYRRTGSKPKCHLRSLRAACAIVHLSAGYSSHQVKAGGTLPETMLTAPGAEEQLREFDGGQCNAPFRRSIYLNASDVAAAAGLNRYEPREGVLARRYRREFKLAAHEIDASVAREAPALAAASVRSSLEALVPAIAEESPVKRARLTQEITATLTRKVYREQMRAVGLPENADIAEAIAEAAAQETTAFAAAEAAERTATTLASEAADLQERSAEQADANLAKAQDAAKRSAEVAHAAREKAAEAQLVKNQLCEAQQVYPRIAKEVSREVNTARGICAEPAAVKAAGFEPGGEKLSCVSFRVGERRFRFGGKVDGRLASGEILEVKQRQRRFLNVPIYERIQVQVYMMIFDQAQCTLREHFTNEFREHVVARDEVWFGNIVRRGLETYAVLWDRMLEDVAFRVEVLRAHPRER